MRPVVSRRQLTGLPKFDVTSAMLEVIVDDVPCFTSIDTITYHESEEWFAIK